MAESAVSLVIDKLVPLLTQKVKLLKDVHDEVAKIKDDLEAIRAFLEDANSKAEKEDINEGVKLWVKQAREVAHQMEDVIDEYVLHVARHHDRHGFVGFLQRISFFVKKLQPRYQTASEVQYLGKMVKEVRDRSEKFQLIPSGHGASTSHAIKPILHDPRSFSLFIEEVNLVGIESPRDELISLLVSEKSQRKVISVVGLGGVGKTTITRKVYGSHNVKGHFGCYAWISVSQSYDINELLRSMLQKFHEEKDEVSPKNIAMMDDLLLIKELREYLQTKRYLVVFDDVWDISFWGDVEHVLLDNDSGSRVLFTTRNEEIANFCTKSSLVQVFRMEPLPHQQAWELFCKKAFKFGFEERCPEDLKELSHLIVRRCGGLPLAIVAVGGLLATKEKKVFEWKRLLDCLGAALVCDPHLENVLKILTLSYGDLPYNLKPCFFFLGMFPEDLCIEYGRIIQLWVAGGFVQHTQGMAIENVAAEYLFELIHRNLVQVDAFDNNGIPFNCRVRVHDMVREVILSKSEELSFCHASSKCSTFKGIARHLSIRNIGSDNPGSSTKSHTRSIMVFDEINLEKHTICTIFTTSKLLTILDFQDCPIDLIPEELGNLLHLQYLNLSSTKVSKLPQSIGKLHNLQFLDLTSSLVEELPAEIDRFPKLMYLSGSDTWDKGLKIQGSIGHLEFLRTLWGIKVDLRFINEIGMLQQLRALGLDELKRENGKDACVLFEKMTALRSLSVGAFNYEDEILEVQSMSSPPPQLHFLQLRGKLERLPEWISKLQNLATIKFWYASLMDDPMKVLQSLPSLRTLIFYYGYNGAEMHFEEGGFLKLKWLYLSRSKELNTMIIDKGAMPVLETLRVGDCPQLKEVPTGIQHLMGLKKLRFVNMSSEFNNRLPSDGGEDYWIVKHVPNLECEKNS